MTSEPSTPTATYRLQLHPDFGFAAAAVAGSTHGYDVVDHTRVRAELGGEHEYRALVDPGEAHCLAYTRSGRVVVAATRLSLRLADAGAGGWRTTQLALPEGEWVELLDGPRCTSRWHSSYPPSTHESSNRRVGPRLGPRRRREPMSDIEIRDDREHGLLRARSGGEVVGHIQYLVLEEPERALAPVHTVVEPEHEGKGIAGSLARELYGIAAREGVAVAPLCPFVVRWAERHPGEAPEAPADLLLAAKAALEADPDKW